MQQRRDARGGGASTRTKRRPQSVHPEAWKENELNGQGRCWEKYFWQARTAGVHVCDKRVVLAALPGPAGCCLGVDSSKRATEGDSGYRRCPPCAPGAMPRSEGGLSHLAAAFFRRACTRLPASATRPMSFILGGSCRAESREEPGWAVQANGQWSPAPKKGKAGPPLTGLRIDPSAMNSPPNPNLEPSDPGGPASRRHGQAPATPSPGCPRRAGMPGGHSR